MASLLLSELHISSWTCPELSLGSLERMYDNPLHKALFSAIDEETTFTFLLKLFP